MLSDEAKQSFLRTSFIPDATLPKTIKANETFYKVFHDIMFNSLLE